MKIGIIVFSHTGHTHSVAQKLKEKLAASGHSADLKRSEISGSYDKGDFMIQTKPDPGPYDAIVFGAPVMAFSLSPVMKQYLSQTETLHGKKTAFLVTEFFPFKWMGGNRAVRKMKKICESKGAQICGSGVVNWSRADREERIADVVETLSSLFKED